MSKAKTATQSNPSTTSTTPSALDENRLLRRPQVQELTGLCTSSIYLGMRRGTFPKAVPIGPRAVAWRARDIMAFLEHGVAGVGNDAE